jgi:hypothetical protein
LFLLRRVKRRIDELKCFGRFRDPMAAQFRRSACKIAGRAAGRLGVMTPLRLPTTVTLIAR